MRSFLHFLFAVCLALACILSYVDGRQGTDELSDTRDQFEDSKIARKGDHAPAKPKNRQPDPEADFNAHVNIVWGGDRQTLAERGWVIGQYMTKGVSFYGLQLLARQGDDFKETTFMPDGDQVDRWPAGAYAQLSYCADAAEGALKQAYSSCKKPNCHEEFYTVSVWGTAQGMNWVKDGVMLFACAAVSVSCRLSCAVAAVRLAHTRTLVTGPKTAWGGFKVEMRGQQWHTTLPAEGDRRFLENGRHLRSSIPPSILYSSLCLLNRRCGPKMSIHLQSLAMARRVCKTFDKTSSTTQKKLGKTSCCRLSRKKGHASHIIQGRTMVRSCDRQLLIIDPSLFFPSRPEAIPCHP